MLRYRPPRLRPVRSESTMSDITMSCSQVMIYGAWPSSTTETAEIGARSLPRTLRMLFRTVGATQRGGSALLSYLLFERSFCRELIGLGYRDAMARKDNLRGFLGMSSNWYCELRAPAA